MITQQPKKIKAYTESKTADRTPQLDPINRHFLPKNVHNAMKLKL